MPDAAAMRVPAGSRRLTAVAIPPAQPVVRRTTKVASTATPTTINTPIATLAITSTLIVPLPMPLLPRYAASMSAPAQDDATAASPAGRLISATAPPATDGQRIDRFLADSAGDLSRSRVKQLIEEGRLTRDGVPVRAPSEPVRAGASYVLTLPPPRPAEPEPQAIPLTILYEDADVIVLDKQAGLVVHPAAGNEDGTLVNALLALGADKLPGIGGEQRPGIIHRLDRDTSGVMVVARTELALTVLSAAFASRDIDRAYLALAWGLPNPAQGSIEGAIGRDPRDRKRMAVVTRGGKPALTHYRLLGHRDGAVALLECRLATGRTHQIRVHLATAGHPVVGDPVYLRRVPAVARALPADLRTRMLDFPRQALHAARLGFKHPRSGQVLTFRTSPPPDMRDLLGTAGLLGCLAEKGDKPGLLS